MRKISVFNSVSVDGYFTDANGDMSWAHQQDPEMDAFASENASGGGELIFGRVTYELMASYWPTPQAHEAMPVVAESMNRSPKVVFSRSLDDASWDHTELVKGDIADVMRDKKQEAGPDMVILGSGTIVSQLTEAQLIDEYQLIVVPVVLGRGRTLFEGVGGNPRLKLLGTRAFDNGSVAMRYEPAN